jgi:tetratricopeptide (TPR) repeat protein
MYEALKYSPAVHPSASFIKKLHQLGIHTPDTNARVLGQKIMTPSYWELVLQKEPEYPDAYLQLAGIKLESEEYDEAEQYVQSALKLDPNNKTARMLLTVLKKMK